MEHTIKLQLQIPSLNKLLRTHWALRRQKKQQWGLVIKNKTKEIKNHQFNRLEITSHRTRMLDYDNLVGGCKEIIVDNIKNLGLIIDDDPKSVLVSYTQKKCDKKNQHTEIKLKNINRK